MDMALMVIGYVLALLVGLSLSLIGGGGSILAVPILKYVIGVPVKEAIAMSLFIVGVVSAIGAIPHWRQGNVNFRTAALFAPVAMAGTYLGAWLTRLPLITPTVQLVAFGIVMVVASLLMIRKGGPTPLPAGEGILTEKKQGFHLPKWVFIPLEGLVVGVLTGIVGVGGGFLIIPALVLLGGVPMKEAVGTSLLIIAFKSATGFWGYLSQVTLDWTLLLGFTLTAGVGTLIGAYLSQFIEGKHLQKGFGYFVLVIAVFILVKR